MEHEDCRVLTLALRNRLVRGPTNCVNSRAEVRTLIDIVEAIGPRSPQFLTGLDVARSLLALRRPEEALDQLDLLLSVVKRAQNDAPMS